MFAREVTYDSLPNVGKIISHCYEERPPLRIGRADLVDPAKDQGSHSNLKDINDGGHGAVSACLHPSNSASRQASGRSHPHIETSVVG